MNGNASAITRCLPSALTLLATASALLAMGRPPAQPASSPRPDLLLVIPARYTLVQMAFDIVKIRPSTALLAYDDQARPDTPVIHLWDGDIRDWIRIDLEQIRSGQRFRKTPQTTLLTGPAATVPAGLAEALKNHGDVSRVEELNLAEIANAVHASQAFTAKEWRWLAARYDIALQDLNAERRRYGRFGKPAEGAAKQQRPAAAQEEEDRLPPPGAVPAEPNADAAPLREENEPPVAPQEEFPAVKESAVIKPTEDSIVPPSSESRTEPPDEPAVLDKDRIAS
jgi:hypothetical protein